MSVIMIYITASHIEEAEEISKALVTEKLVACTNILPNMRSAYIWEGEYTESEEIILLAKTTADKFDAVEARVKEIHSYDCPCIISLSIDQGHTPYLEWLQNSVL